LNEGNLLVFFTLRFSSIAVESGPGLKAQQGRAWAEGPYLFSVDEAAPRSAAFRLQMPNIGSGAGYSPALGLADVSAA